MVSPFLYLFGGRRRGPSALRAGSSRVRARRSASRALRAAPAGAGRSARSVPGRCGSLRSARRAPVPGRCSYHHQIDEVIYRRLLEPLLVLAQIEDRLLLLRRKAPREVALELLDQARDAFLAAALVPERILDHHLRERAAVIELDGERVRDRALLGVQVVFAELLVLDAGHLVSQTIDAGIARDVVLVVRRREAAEDERHGDHVLDAVVAVRRVRKRSLLVDYADRRLVGPDPDFLNVFSRFAARFHLLKDGQRRFGRRLGVELGGEGDLEEDVLDHVAAVGALELERLPLEEHVVEAPGLRG